MTSGGTSAFSWRSVSAIGHWFISSFTLLESRDGILDSGTSLDLLEKEFERSRGYSRGQNQKSQLRHRDLVDEIENCV